jgi:hypothetical protein
MRDLFRGRKNEVANKAGARISVPVLRAGRVFADTSDESAWQALIPFFFKT